MLVATLGSMNQKTQKTLSRQNTVNKVHKVVKVNKVVIVNAKPFLENTSLANQAPHSFPPPSERESTKHIFLPDLV